MNRLGIKKIFFGSLLTLLLTTEAEALPAPHPVELYEAGMHKLNTYYGDDAHIEEAKEIFSSLVSKYPQSPFGHLGMSMAYLIEAYHRPDQYDMAAVSNYALPFALKALETGSSIREVHDNFSRIEAIFSRHAEQQRRASSFLQLFPDHPETYFIVANFVLAQGERDSALEYFLYALQLKPSATLAIKISKRAALIYLNQKDDPEKAIAILKKALEMTTNDSDLMEYLGRAYLKIGDYGQSVSYLSEALKLCDLRGRHYYLFLAKGLGAEKEGEIDQAIQYLEKAQEFKRQDGQIKIKLGNLYLSRKNYESAYKHFKQAIQLRPRDPMVYFYAGKAADSLGDRMVAQDHYRNYLRLKTDSQEASWIRSRISELSDDPKPLKR